MGHVKQKKSTSSSTSTPPEQLAIEVGCKDSASSHRESRYPAQLNAEELISQINCSRNLNSSSNINNSSGRNDITSNVNGSNNNDSNNNNSTIHRTNQQQSAHNESSDDVEKGSEHRRHVRQKPLLRRLFSFIRSLWMGAKFNVGKAGEFVVGPQHDYIQIFTVILTHLVNHSRRRHQILNR
jgi:hypothetical protein